MSYLKFLTLATPLALALFSPCVQAQTTPAEQIAGYVAQSGQPAQAARGQEFFTSKHGKDWSCSTCHTELPAATGQHTVTKKPIRPLAPTANAERFTNQDKVDKWFKRNCNDVLKRACTAQEKGDVLAYLMTVKP